MTSEQFDALAVLMGQPDSKSAAAARLVLVEGLSSADAARRVGITTQGANQAVQRCRRVLELARVVCGDGGWISCGLHHSANKHDSRCRSLQRHDAISDALEALGSLNF